VLHPEGQLIVDNRQSLEQELGALQHELRRVHDALQRNRTRDLEQHACRLRDNIALCEKELKQLATPLQSAAD
jgi:hypothetical protein